MASCPSNYLINVCQIILNPHLRSIVSVFRIIVEQKLTVYSLQYTPLCIASFHCCRVFFPFVPLCLRTCLTQHMCLHATTQGK